MNIDIPLKSAQQEQLACLLSRVMTHGFGRVEIRIEKGEARWFRHSSMIYNPNAQQFILVEPRPLGEMLGVWLDMFSETLCTILGERWGSVFLGIEHGKIRYIEAAPEVRARTGNTGPLISDRPPCRGPQPPART